MDVSTPLDATAGTAEDGMIDDLKIFSKKFQKGVDKPVQMWYY